LGSENLAVFEGWNR